LNELLAIRRSTTVLHANNKSPPDQPETRSRSKRRRDRSIESGWRPDAYEIGLGTGFGGGREMTSGLVVVGRRWGKDEGDRDEEEWGMVVG
jgi:hypothetical protein